MRMAAFPCSKTIQGLIPGITVDYYVRANFAGFVKIIDAVGGVTINVEERMVYHTSDTNIDLKPGLQHLNGTKALEYMRFRDDGVGDFGSWGGQGARTRGATEESAQGRHRTDDRPAQCLAFYQQLLQPLAMQCRRTCRPPRWCS